MYIYIYIYVYIYIYTCIDKACRQSWLINVLAPGICTARRHDWFYHTSTKCAIPDDIAGQQRFQEALVTSAQHERAKAFALHIISQMLAGMIRCSGNALASGVSSSSFYSTTP